MISQKAKYALRALIALCKAPPEASIMIAEISRTQAIPKKFLEQILLELKRAGIVGSKRGPQGGYSLAGQAGSIRLGDVIRALEGPMLLSDGAEKSEGGVVEVTEAIFRDLSRRVEACFDAVTLADICAQAERMGLPRVQTESYSYVI